MRGGKNKQPLGYTIIEVMIVLAVSGVMFAIAATFISGKQARTSFTAGSNEFNGQVQTVISNVIDGQYSDVSFSCSTNAAHTVITIDDTPQAQGAKPACVFIGKAIKLSDYGNTAKFAVYPLAASRVSTSLTHTTPIIGNGGSIDLTDHQAISQNLDVVSPGGVRVIDTGGAAHTNATAIVIAQNPNPDGITAAQTVGLYYTTSSLIEGSNVSLIAARSATICLTDGQRRAVIQIGDQSSSASQLSAKLQVVNTCP